MLYEVITPGIASCYHTRFISTSDKARFPGGTHVEFHHGNAGEKALEVVRMAIEAFTKRDPKRVLIPSEPVEIV